MKELLIKNGLVYTYIYEGYHAIKLQEADVFIKDGLISDVAPNLNYSCSRLDASGCLVLPGMVNMGASTFAARILSGLVCDWSRGQSRIAPMLELAVGILTEDEIAAVAATGLWDALASGATTVCEACRDDRGGGKTHPLYYRAAPEAVARGVMKAGQALGVRACLAYLDEANGLTVRTGNGMDIAVERNVVSDSAVACADFGYAYEEAPRILSGAKLAMGTGPTSSCMIEEMKTTARMVKQATGSPDAYRASDVFYSATVVGGRELDENKHGRLGIGFAGDVSVVSMGRFSSLSYPLSQYVYGASPADVRHVVCDGTPVKLDCKPENRLKGFLSDASKTASFAMPRLWAEARRSIL